MREIYGKPKIKQEPYVPELYCALCNRIPVIKNELKRGKEPKILINYLTGIELQIMKVSPVRGMEPEVVLYFVCKRCEGIIHQKMMRIIKGQAPMPIEHMKPVPKGPDSDRAMVTEFIEAVAGMEEKARPEPPQKAVEVSHGENGTDLKEALEIIKEKGNLPDESKEKPKGRWARIYKAIRDAWYGYDE